MTMIKEVVLKDSVEIDAIPEKIWDFFLNLETNYKAWHPESHVLLRYLKGNPHEKGSIVYAEEILGGKVRKIKMICTNVEKYRKVEYETFFPLSIFHPNSAYIFEPKGQRCIFTAINRFKIPKLFKKKVESLVKETETHVKEEGTGIPQPIKKIEIMSEITRKNKKKIAIASGITPENVKNYLMADIFMVATGISYDFTRLNPQLVKKLHDYLADE